MCLLSREIIFYDVDVLTIFNPCLGLIFIHVVPGCLLIIFNVCFIFCLWLLILSEGVSCYHCIDWDVICVWPSILSVNYVCFETKCLGKYLDLTRKKARNLCHYIMMNFTLYTGRVVLLWNLKGYSDQGMAIGWWSKACTKNFGDETFWKMVRLSVGRWTRREENSIK
jgi:hypothetical protein